MGKKQHRKGGLPSIGTFLQRHEIYRNLIMLAKSVIALCEMQSLLQLYRLAGILIRRANVRVST